jgi:hypothetical protein
MSPPSQIKTQHNYLFLPLAFYPPMNYKITLYNQPQKSIIINNSQADADKPVCNPPGGVVLTIK